MIGGVWPPEGLETLSPWGVPLLNTVVLLTSGATVTWAHHGIVAGAKKKFSTRLSSNNYTCYYFYWITGF